MSIDPELLRRIVEGALLAASQALSEERLLSLIDAGERPQKTELRAVLQQIAASCGGRGFELREVASGWRFQVPQDLAPWINRLWEEKPQRYSRATLETLAIIAYRQPITRGDIEEIRGVAVSSHIIRSLSERGWIKVVGQRDVPGKPALFATTREFLDYFNLRSLDQLPSLAEMRDIESLSQALEQDGQLPAMAASAAEPHSLPSEAETVDESDQNLAAVTAATERDGGDAKYATYATAGVFSDEVVHAESQQTIREQEYPSSNQLPSATSIEQDQVGRDQSESVQATAANREQEILS